MKKIVLAAICGLSACGGGNASAPAVTPPPVVSPAPVIPAGGIPSGWKLVWADEFAIDGLPNTAAWDFDTSRNKLGWYNNELQYYSRDRLENARVAEGKLIIKAVKESH